MLLNALIMILNYQILTLFEVQINLYMS